MLNNVKTLIYIITGEYAGIQEICEAFETEEEQHKAFEEKTGFSISTLPFCAYFC